jgi:hypothetical protein
VHVGAHCAPVESWAQRLDAVGQAAAEQSTLHIPEGNPALAGAQVRPPLQSATERQESPSWPGDAPTSWHADETQRCEAAQSRAELHWLLWHPARIAAAAQQAIAVWKFIIPSTL